MNVRVVLGGPSTTVQDIGRRGMQHDGVPESGAMDTMAARIANLLVGNEENAALLESTLAGPALLFSNAAVVALGGGDFGATLDGEPVAPWHAFPVRPGATLALGNARSGCRAYIAIGGGIDVPVVLGSRSTCTLARFGGFEGRHLRAGDTLHVNDTSLPNVRRALTASLRPVLATTVRLIAGEHQALLDDESRGALFGDALRVSPRSDRMGYRLAGATLQLRDPIELLSAGVTSGTLQLPPGGEPILLMADHQTTGGYPVLGHVASVDLGAVAQLRPGDSIRFSEISLDDAQRLYLERERSLDALRRALSYPA
jgi:antagonist of KipI